MNRTHVHDGDYRLRGPFTYPQPEWRGPGTLAGPVEETFRHCSYCGSIHPDDLLPHLVGLKRRGPTPLEPLVPEGASHEEVLRLWEACRAEVAVWSRVPSLDMADWKYGWPHKFYVSHVIPNPLAGQTVEVGSQWENGEKVGAVLGPAPTHAHAKFYSVHMRDASDFAALSREVERLTGVRFLIRDDVVAWEYASRGGDDPTSGGTEAATDPTPSGLHEPINEA